MLQPQRVFRFSVRDVSFAPHDCNEIVVGTESGQLQLWDVRKFDKCTKKWPAHNGLLTFLLIFHNENYSGSFIRPYFCGGLASGIALHSGLSRTGQANQDLEYQRCDFGILCTLHWTRWEGMKILH